MTIVCKPEEFAEKFTWTELLHLKQLNGGILRAAKDGIGILQGVVPIDTHRLQQNIELEVNDPNTMNGTVCTIVENTPYAAVMETGSRPFMPPFMPIYAWVLRHARSFSVGSARSIAGKIDRGQDLVRVARAVQFSISRKGLAAHWHTRDSRDELVAILGVYLQRYARLKRGTSP